MMRYFYDTEFIEDGRTICLISIGIVAADGREYQETVSEIADDPLYKRITDDDWLMKHVVPGLPLMTHPDGGKVMRPRDRPSGGMFILDFVDPGVLPKWVIAKQVKAFLLATNEAPELWAYYGAYDHVALCQLWGRMESLPKGIPMFTNDLRQEAGRLGNPRLPEQDEGTQHNALDDARWNRAVFDFLSEECAGPGPQKQ